LNDEPHNHKRTASMHIHEHEDHFHAHEHYHGDSDNIIVTTIGLVIHSIADGLALGASLFRTII
jgi:zinc transporter ZupT